MIPRTQSRRRLTVIDLFCGLKGWSQPFIDRGHRVVTLDLDPKFKADMVRDIMEVEAADFPCPDVVLASPPCEGWSVMNIGKNWTEEHEPKTAKAVESMLMVEKTIELIRALAPAYFVIENPRAKLRKMPMMEQFEMRTVTYCKYGEKRMKPTDLWGGFPPSLDLYAACNNGDDCHVRAPRGSRTGTQGMGKAESAKIPYQLALAVCLACERSFGP